MADEAWAVDEDARVQVENAAAQAVRDEAELEAWACAERGAAVAALEAADKDAQWQPDWQPDWRDDPSMWQDEPAAESEPPPELLAAWAQEWEAGEEFKKALDDEMERSARRLSAMSEALPVDRWTDLSAFIAVAVGQLHACPRAAEHAAQAINTLVHRLTEPRYLVELVHAKGGISALIGMLCSNSDAAVVAATNVMASLASCAQSPALAEEVGTDIEVLLGLMRRRNDTAVSTSPSAMAARAVTALVVSHVMASPSRSLFVLGKWNVRHLVHTLLDCVSRSDGGFALQQEARTSAAQALEAILAHIARLLCGSMRPAIAMRSASTICEACLAEFRERGGIAKLASLLDACEANWAKIVLRQQCISTVTRVCYWHYQLVHGGLELLFSPEAAHNYDRLSSHVHAAAVVEAGLVPILVRLHEQHLISHGSPLLDAGLGFLEGPRPPGLLELLARSATAHTSSLHNHSSLLLEEFCRPGILTSMLRSYSPIMSPTLPPTLLYVFSRLISQSRQVATAVIHLVMPPKSPSSPSPSSPRDRADVQAAALLPILQAFCLRSGAAIAFDVRSRLCAETCALVLLAGINEDVEGLRRSLSLARALEVDAEELAAGSAALQRLECEAERHARRMSLGISHLGYPEDFNCPSASTAPPPAPLVLDPSRMEAP